MLISNDGLIDIMIGRNRFEKRWQHKEMRWAALVKRLETTHRTTESYKEYIKSTPDRQSTIKDIGGFVGGLMSGGRRKNGSIIHRQLITLDADNNPDIEEILKTNKHRNIACCIYSTHKHSVESARLRLILPLKEPVDIDEYEAIARMVASWYDIDVFDPTTFQPTRLMYWPSTSKNGEYYFHYNNGQWVIPSKVLAEYNDWSNVTEWPVSSSEKAKVDTLKVKQQDPLEKTGMIGSFCRTYTIPEVIDRYLPDIYEKGTIENRYTYRNGSTSNGLVIYEDTFAYSHHSTDPVSGVLCNSWDLVRLHKFGSLDDMVEGTRIKKPSTTAMYELVATDADVRITVGREKLTEAQELFGNFEESQKESEPVDSWLKKMEIDSKGNYLNTINNSVLVLDNDPTFKGKFKYDDMKKSIVIDGKLPWRGKEGIYTQIADEDFAAIRHYLELIYKLSSITKIDDAIAIVAKKHLFHPIRDWIASIKWDGQERAEELFMTYLGANDTAYTRMVTRKALLACVYRIHEPGCKFDNMIVLIGEQGIGKSTIIRKLGHKWYNESLTNINTKESFEQLQGAWIIEFGELNSIRNAEVEAIKHFLSKTKDDYRPSYGRTVQEFLRQCVFFGTTNAMYFLKDVTGNRRFWPLVCDLSQATEDVFAGFTLEEVKQVWAEVYTWYLMGEAIHLPLKTQFEASKVQAKHMENDDRIGMVEEFLEIRLPDNWYEIGIYEKRAYLEGDELVQTGKMQRTMVSAIELYCELFRGTYKDYNTRIGREMFQLLRQIPNWENKDKKWKIPYYGRQRVFQRIPNKTKSNSTHWTND